MSRAVALLLFVIVAAPLVAAPPYPPTELPGALVLSGSGSVPKLAREGVVALGGGKGKAKIVIISTDGKAKPDEMLKAWKELEPASVAMLEPGKAADQLADATAVWITGTDTKKVADFLEEMKLAKPVFELFQRGGVVGGEAGLSQYSGDQMIAAKGKLAVGLGLLPGILLTEQKRLPDLQATIDANPPYAGIGLGEGTALVARGRIMAIVGDGTATVCWAKSSTKPARADLLKTGSQLDLFQVRRAAAFRAMTPPFPLKDPPVPLVAKGSLMIVGGGGAGKEIWERFIELAGGPKALIVFLPTALEDPLPPGFSEVRALKQNGAENIKVLHTRDRKTADDPAFSADLLKAGGVWFGGGRQWRFVDSYEGTLAGKRFHEVLARGGAIGGSSAGASIQSEYMPRGHPLGNTVMAAEGYERGFGFLPGCAVDQHFFARKRTADMTGLMEKYPQLLGIGLDEGTAIVVKGSVAEVIGKTKVGFYDYRNGKPKGDKDYIEVPTGGKYQLKERRVLP